MKRAVVAILVMALLAGGCATPATHFPPNCDPAELTATIVRKEQEDRPVEPEAPKSYVLSDCLEGAATAAEFCWKLCVGLAYAIAKSHCPNSPPDAY
jgi:hypothetical protein